MIQYIWKFGVGSYELGWRASCGGWSSCSWMICASSWGEEVRYAVGSPRDTCLVSILLSHLWCKICSNTRLDTWYGMMIGVLRLSILRRVLNRRWCMWLMMHFSACYYTTWCMMHQLRSAILLLWVDLCCTLLEGLRLIPVSWRRRERRRLGNDQWIWLTVYKVDRWWLLLVGAFILDKSMGSMRCLCLGSPGMILTFRWLMSHLFTS